MKREIFKPVAIVALITLVLVAGFGVYLLLQKSQHLEAMKLKNEFLTDEMYYRDSTINDLIVAFNEIDDNLTFIKKRRSQLSLESEKEMNLDRKTAILRDIKLMDSMLVASSRHIEDLEKRLKESGVKMRSFENRIASLNKTLKENSEEIDVLRSTIEEKNYQIADLSSRVEQYQTVVEEKEETIKTKELVIAEKVNEINQLNTAWYTLGTFKQLKEHGILDRSGGLLGIGSTKTIRPNLTNDYFTTLDIREVKTIPIASKSAKIITDHPEDSYEFIYEDGMISALVIENPDEFWKISKYAVIETK